MDNQEHQIIHNNQPQTGSLAPNIPNPLVGDIKFKNDFGETPVGLAHFTKDQGAIAILSLAGAFVGAALGGLPAAGVILLAMMNDIKYAGRAEAPLSAPDGVIDVPSSSVGDTHTATQPQEPIAEHELEVQPPQPIKKPTQSKPITVVLFDFERLRTEPDKFAHLRVIGGTGIGKTTFVDWLLDILGGDRFVITPKKKSWNWVGLKVYGLWFDYETIRAKLQWIHAEMYRRYPLMEQGQAFEITNFVVDEWRLINTNIKAIKERDPETKQTIEIAPSAKAMMKDIITVARESMLRLIALAQGENVASWGFEGESDLEECFTDIRLGEFALDHAKSLRNQCRKDSEDYEYWTAVLSELDWQQSRRTSGGKSIPCCMVGKYPARIPDLTDWRREVVDIDSEKPEEEEQSVAKKEAAIFASEDIRKRLEALIKATPHEKVLPQSESAKKVLEIIQLATKHPISFESIRKSRKWENNSPDKATLLAALNELSSEWIRGNEIEGYYLQD